MLYAESISRLIDELGRLPGIGPKTAQRLAFYLLKQEPEAVKRLAQSMLDAREKLKYCSVCQNITDQDPCRLCQSNIRDRQMVMVVEEAKDVVAMERTREYKGVYHVLQGSISPMEGIGPEQLRVRELLERLRDPHIQEVILATNSDVEGEATSLYLARLLKPTGIKVTRIARGLPVGGDLDYADEVTLIRAFEGRVEV